MAVRENIIITGEDRASQVFDRAGGNFEKLTSRIFGAIKGVGLLTLGSQALEVVGHLDVLGQQMQANERMANTVFAGMESAARRWADASNEAFGIGENAMLGMLSKTQDLLVPMGFARDTAFEMSGEILNVANALSEWEGGTITATDAQQRLVKAMLGEREGLVELGVKISEADLKARLSARGLDRLTGAALDQAKAQVTLELVMEKSTDALTAYEDRAGSAAAAQKELAASTADTSESWADLFRPIIDTGKQAMSDAAQIAQYLSNELVDLTDSTGMANREGQGLVDLWRISTPVGALLLEGLHNLAEAAHDTARGSGSAARGMAGMADAAKDDLNPALAASLNALRGYTSAQWSAAEATSHHSAQAAALGDVLAGQISPVLGAHSALEDLADAQKGADEAAREHGRSSEEFALAQVDLALKTAIAQQALGEFGTDADASIRAVSQALGISTEAARIYLETLDLLDGKQVTSTIVLRQINLLEEGVIPEGVGISDPTGPGQPIRTPIVGPYHSGGDVPNIFGGGDLFALVQPGEIISPPQDFAELTREVRQGLSMMAGMATQNSGGGGDITLNFEFNGFGLEELDARYMAETIESELAAKLLISKLMPVLR